MEKIKILLSKNNYMLSKIFGAVFSVVVVIAAIVMIVSGNESEPREGETTREIYSSLEATTKISEIDSRESSEIESTSTDETTIIESSDESTTPLEDESITKEEEITSKVPTGNNEKSTSDKPITSTTTQAPTTTTQVPATAQAPTTTTPAITTTQAPTTTTQQETTTEEETTTAPPRGANGVILEELTVHFVNGDLYTVPYDVKQFVKELGEESYYGPKSNHVSTVVKQDVFGNEIMLYDSANKTGNVAYDVKLVYGEPMYEVSVDDGSIRLYYKYYDVNVSNEEAIYVVFSFSQTNELKLSAILFGRYVDFVSDGDIKEES